MKQCLAGNTSWQIALLEYLSTPLGPNIPSPSELMARQFRGILPFFQDRGAAESVKEHVMLQKEKEKCRHQHQFMTCLSYQLVLQSPTLTKTSKLGPLVGLTAMKADPMWWPQKKEG